MRKLGQVILTHIQYTDTYEVKTRPAVVLFEEYGNIIVAGITSNTQMKGIPLTKQEGAIKESVIKLNYIFTIGEKMIKKELFTLNKEKQEHIRKELITRISE